MPAGSAPESESIAMPARGRRLPRLRWVFLSILLLTGLAWLGFQELSRVPVRIPERKVVVLGFDGADPRLCREYMEKGLMPNLSALAQTGTFEELAPVNPSMSPVSWSSFAVGGDPGQHGIYDFLTRLPTDPTYLPNPESFVGQIEARFFAGIPIRPPKVFNKRGGRAFWDYASEDGIKTALVMVPVTFAPPCLPNGLAISGLGVPDLCGTQATYFSLTSDTSKVGSGKQTEFGGLVSVLAKQGNLYLGQLIGPPSPIWKQEKSKKAEALAQARHKAAAEGLSPSEKETVEVEAGRAEEALRSFTNSPERLSMPIAIETQAGGGGARIRIGEEAQEVGLGKWSDWYRVHFKVTPFISAYGICKALLQSVTPEVRVYVSPIEISPEKPIIPICCPGSYCRLLTKKIGLYKTRGWESDTAGLKEGALDEKGFLQDTFATMDKHAEMALETLAHDDWSLYVAVLSETDRVSHMMWRLIDPKHPLYDPALAAEYGDSIQKVYQKMDEIVGRFRERIDESKTDFYVLSDHGFRTFRKGVNINTWLSRHGPADDASRPFMRLRIPPNRKFNLQDLFGGNTDFFKTTVADPVTGASRTEYYVDWSETKAFGLGLSSIFINLKGRETYGCVPRSRYNAVCDEIIRGLESLVDPETGQRVVHKVYRGSDIFHGPFAKVESVAFPDLVVGFEEGYRVGWQSTLGGISEDVLSPNREKWSGDHCGVDPSLTGGILLSNRRMNPSHAGIIDLAPTILATLGVRHPGMQGQDLRGAEMKETK
jgi:predicted AlkP superfamily phosphohydrolase/phosphomutase